MVEIGAMVLVERTCLWTGSVLDGRSSLGVWSRPGLLLGGCKSPFSNCYIWPEPASICSLVYEISFSLLSVRL